MVVLLAGLKTDRDNAVDGTTFQNFLQVAYGLHSQLALMKEYAILKAKGRRRVQKASKFSKDFRN